MVIILDGSSENDAHTSSHPFVNQLSLQPDKTTVEKEIFYHELIFIAVILRNLIWV